MWQMALQAESQQCTKEEELESPLEKDSNSLVCANLLANKIEDGARIKLNALCPFHGKKVMSEQYEQKSQLEFKS